jgi:putative ATPase
MDLFQHNNQTSHQGPLAERLRPQRLSELVGQEQVFRTHSSLFKMLKQGQLQSLILWGPPGCGKTSFARAMVHELPALFIQENAIDLSVKKIREIGTDARQRLLSVQEKTILFVDEIHRLNKGQQDVLLPFVEKGHFYLIGATTENPSYELNGALMSRCRLLVFEPIAASGLEQIITKALEQSGLSQEQVLLESGLETLIQSCHGDARSLLNSVEEVIFSYQAQSNDFPLDGQRVNQLLSHSSVRFDKKGDEHYDTISAFIKSIRGSDPDAAVYYLARLIEGGEDPKFIARRLVILASEDIGNADPNALTLAVNVFRAVEIIGLPEARINLAQAVTYMACAPKSNRSYMAINKAQSEVKKSGSLSIPKALRSASTSLMKSIGYGDGYKYSHEGDRGWVDQEFLPQTLRQEKYYEPSARGFEKKLQDYLNWLRGQKTDPKK